MQQKNFECFQSKTYVLNIERSKKYFENLWDNDSYMELSRQGFTMKWHLVSQSIVTK